MNDLYEELYLSTSSGLEDIRRILTKQRRDWTARSDGMPEEASRMLALIDEADAVFADEESRAAYEAELAASRQPTQDPDRDAQRQADYERFCALASDYYDTDEFDLAEVAIGNALKNAPVAGADLGLCTLAAQTYFALGKYDPALTYVNQAIVQAPDDPSLYLYKFRVASRLAKTTPDDRRGSPDALVNVLRITIRKAETAGSNKTLAQALDALAGRVFARRSAETDEEARQLASRALAIDSSLEYALKVVATLDAEEKQRLERERAEEQQRERERRFRAVEATINVAGGPVWVLLNVDQDFKRALFITRDIIAQKPYNEKYVDITWENCSLRRWLNTAFLESLPAEIKSRVIEVTNQNPNNSSYSTKGGNPTKDRVFLLSMDEVRSYFKSDSDRIAKFNGSAGWWWLRSPGGYQRGAASVDDGGTVDGHGHGVYNDGGGVRPALFLNLDA